MCVSLEIDVQTNQWFLRSRRSAVMRTSPPRSKIGWLGYSVDGKLVTLEDGVLVVWRAGENEIKASYSSVVPYRLPVQFSPDGILLGASRGKSLDLINPVDGKLKGRLAAAVEGGVVDFAFCPDGQHVAVLYEAEKEWIKAKVQRVTPYHPSPSQAAIVIWDLKKGEGRVSAIGTSNVSQVAWMSTDHLAYLGSGINVYDLRLNRNILTYGFRAIRGPDGRVWNYDTCESQTGTWKLPSLLINPTPEEKLYFAADRELLNLQARPIRVEIDLGDPALGKARGEMALKGLRKRGCTIGGSGHVMKITMEIIDTNSELTFQGGLTIKIPTIWYTWKLFDDRGRDVAVSNTRGAWDMRKSMYVTKPDYETRVTTGADGYFDFQGKNPRNAIIQEILKTPMGFTEAPEFPTELIRIGDKYSKASRAGDMSGKK